MCKTTQQKVHAVQSRTGADKSSLTAVMNEIYKPERLPRRVEEKYQVLSTLAYSEFKSVCLLKGKEDKKKYICKWRSLDKGMRLKAEYECLLTLQADRTGQDRAGGQDKSGYFPKVYAYFQENGREYLIREYLEGVTLADDLEEHGPCTVREAVDILLPVCDMLSLLHAQDPPRIHRDIKPDNILISKDTEGAKQFHLIDLDTVREYKKTGHRDTVFIGTIETAAPEQFGYQQTSVRTDIYSLGMLLVYLLTGEYSVYNSHWEKVPKEMRRIVSRCLAIDPSDRYPSVKRLKRELSCMKRFACRYTTLCTRLAGILLTAGMASFLVYHGIRDYRYKNESVQFANEQVHQAAMQALGKNEQDIIYPYELEQVTTLILCSDRIFTSWQEHQDFHDNEWFTFNEEVRRTQPADLSDLKYFPNLHTLVLDNQGIEDLTMLDGLLPERLSMQKNELKNLDGISRFHTLSSLYLTDNPLDDVNALSGMTSLREIRLSESSVSDISPLTGLPIQNLDVSNTLVTDISGISSMQGLERLMISGVGTESIKELGRMQNLRSLGIFESDIASLSEISGLKLLDTLDLTQCSKMHSLDGIDAFPKLHYLGIAGTEITDISALKDNPILEMIDMTNAPVTDFSVLKDIPNLNTIWIDSGKEALIDREAIPDVEVWVQ